MVGIGGGSPSQADMYLGDIVVGTKVVQYDMGKVVLDGQFQETADAKAPAPLLNSAVSNLRSRCRQHHPNNRVITLLRSRLPTPTYTRPSQPDRLFQSTYEHPPNATSCDKCDPARLQPRGSRLSDEPRIHYGVIASGNRVMKNGIVRDNIAQRHLAMCFEMEAAGMMDILRCLPIRGICDYSDSHKNKEWQDYAAATAAAYARALLEVLPPQHQRTTLGESAMSQVQHVYMVWTRAPRTRRWVIVSLLVLLVLTATIVGLCLRFLSKRSETTGYVRGSEWRAEWP
jgi:nucleoside phosphorylase